MSLADKVLFITGGSRGIGRSIALRAAQDGAKIVIAAKTKDPHPKLPGTIYTVAEEIEKAGGKALPCVVDIRFEDQLQHAVDQTIKSFGGIDVLVNNASAINLTNTLSTSMKSYDLMMNINARGTYLCSKLCIPHLKKATNPHILNLSPPLNMSPKWFSNHLAYTMAKYGMSMCVLGMAKELRSFGIAVNALWPRMVIYTAATRMLAGDGFAKQCRHPEIMSDAAYAILTKSSTDPKYTGNFFIDEDLLRQEGVDDFTKYAIEPGSRLAPDIYLDDMDEEFSMENQAPEDAATVKEVLIQMQSLLSEDIVNAVQASYYFKLTGAEPGEWYLNLKSEKGTLGNATDAGIDTQSFDCRFEVSSENFVRMFKGELVPSKAFMAGTMQMDGDLFAAIKLEKILRKLNK